MYCANCGKEIGENEKYCSQCGNPSAGTAAQKTERKNNALIIGLCCAVAILVVGIFVVGVFLGKSDGYKIQVDAPAESTEATEMSTTKKPVETTVKVTTTKASGTKPTDSKGIVEPDYPMLGSIYYVEPEEGLYLRKGPGKQYADLSILKQGTAMTEIGNRADSPGWTYVRLMDGVTCGWVSTAYLTYSNPNTDPELLYRYYYYSNRIDTVVLDKEGLNLRTGASRDCRRLGTIPYMRTVTVIGYSAYDVNWLYVSVYLDGRTQYGYVDGRYLQH